MNKLIVLIMIIFLFIGCSSYNRLIKEIPLVEFDSFSYHRAGNISSATITAIGAKIENEEISIHELHITEDWGPFINFNIQ